MTMTLSPADYWEARAARYSHVDAGLPAVCSYGMPRLYNEAIHLLQARALSPWIHNSVGLKVLDVGCGVGRWSRRFAAYGASVTGVDISQTMVETAGRHADSLSLDCTFVRGSAQDFDLSGRFDLCVVVTVLQHILDPAAYLAALANLRRHLKPGGRLLLMEVAPNSPVDRCDSDIFQARTLGAYLRTLGEARFEVESVTGVDLSPLRPYVLPLTRRLPWTIGRWLLTATTLATLPLDLAFSSRVPAQAWHKLIAARAT